MGDTSDRVARILKRALERLVSNPTCAEHDCCKVAEAHEAAFDNAVQALMDVRILYKGDVAPTERDEEGNSWKFYPDEHGGYLVDPQGRKWYLATRGTDPT